MIIHNFDPVLIDFGFVQIRWYSIAYIAGIILGWLYAIKIINKTENNTYNYTPIKREDFNDLIILLVLGIVLGGRLGYVIFYNFTHYSQNFLDIFKVWQGGMSFHGGLLGVIISIIIFSKKRNLDFFIFSDIVACAAPIGLFLGRVANFINGELYGKISNLPWAIIFPHAGNIARHPSQIYEAFLEGVVLFIIINFLAIKKKLLFKKGYISGIFLILYSVLRAFSEIFREPDKNIGFLFDHFSMGVLLSFFTFVIGFIIFISAKKNEQNN